MRRKSRKSRGRRENEPGFLRLQRHFNLGTVLPPTETLKYSVCGDMKIASCTKAHGGYWLLLYGRASSRPGGRCASVRQHGVRAGRGMYVRMYVCITARPGSYIYLSVCLSVCLFVCLAVLPSSTWVRSHCSALTIGGSQFPILRGETEWITNSRYPRGGFCFKFKFISQSSNSVMIMHSLLHSYY